MLRILALVLATPVAGWLGFFLGALAGTYVACYITSPESNLCGLVGLFVTGPITAILAVVSVLYFGWPRAGQ